MSNNIQKYEHDRLSNITVLTIRQMDGYYGRDYAPEICAKFLQSAEQLPDKEFLGWQLTADKEGHWTNVVFSSPGVRVEPEDFNWIFQGFAETGSGSAEMPDGIPYKQGKVYALRCLPSAGEEKEDYAWNYGYNRSTYVWNQQFFEEMLGLVRDAGGFIRILAGSCPDGSAGQGTILLGLPEEITLRMRTTISLAFSGMAVKAFSEREALEDPACRLPAKCLKCGMLGILKALMDEQVKAGDVGEYSDDELVDDDTDDMLPLLDGDSDDAAAPGLLLEDLDLSVRSYNCLKRAGIHTVEELQRSKDNDFRNVRNFSRKSAEEVRRKLVSLEAQKASAQQPAPDCLAMLNELVGLGEVKEQVRKITAYAKMKQDLSRMGKESVPVVLNMEFVGNPGTAKTTVARILSGILHQSGLISDSGIVEVGRADLVAKYEGQTADKVKEVFKKARGKVLFLDEAYSLVENWDGEFGDEAINTIVQEMENHREDTIVIFAGYPDKMEEFFSRNPGLRSRVPFRIRFADYSADELAQIAELEARRRGFAIAPQAKEKVRFLCGEAQKRPNMGNGRFCRNLVESAVLAYAARVYGGRDEACGGDFSLGEEDFVLPDVLKEAKGKRPVGFRA